MLSDRRLVAYIVSIKEQSPDVRELCRFLQQKLLEYMVPAVFVLLDALPLTPNRKVDRKALPYPEQTRPSLNNTFVAPRTPAEQSCGARR
jgi:acyl-CoA synthetase (AMP-forming)/AMP-acid ligase II